MSDADQTSGEAVRVPATQEVTGSGPAATTTSTSTSTSNSTTAGILGQGFVQPSSYLRPQGRSRPVTPAPPSSNLDREQAEGLRAVRAFLKVRTSYDVLPLSSRLIAFETDLLVKKSLDILVQNGIVSAPLMDETRTKFKGLLTTVDYINVIQYYWANPDALREIDRFQLSSLREVEKKIGVAPLETISIDPTKPLYEACRRMLESRARRIPLIDIDPDSGHHHIASVLTQYRILKFVAVNVKETQMLRKPLGDLSVGTYKDLVFSTLDQPVIDVIHKLVKHNISNIPILDAEGLVSNVFESVDVIGLIKGGVYDDLNLTVGEALAKRPENFPGIFTCTLTDQLDTIFDTIRKSRVHRFVVVNDTNHLCGILTLSDILEYILLDGESGDI